MCGFVAVVGEQVPPEVAAASLARLEHRGPDARGAWTGQDAVACYLGHRRLSVLDLSDAGTQPMSDSDGRYHIVYNGEIYNYLELRSALGGSSSFHTGTDTEVLLRAFARWGPGCLDRLIGMFAFVIWDTAERRLFAARDRFGVKPLFIGSLAGGGLALASEIKALHELGIPRRPDPVTWATYLTSGMYDHGRRTFWEGVQHLEAGEYLEWTPRQGASRRTWYDPAAAALAAGVDERSEAVVCDELLALLEETVRLRFRSDVPVGICLSGGLDSSLLFALTTRVLGADAGIHSYTFFSGDARYDETPWVEQLVGYRPQARFCRLDPSDVPSLAERMQDAQDEPFGGMPTLGMAKVYERAAADGVVVLLDGNGVDEGWCGYEYYARAGAVSSTLGPVQGSRSRSTWPECLVPDFAALAEPLVPDTPFHDPVRDLQYRDIRFAKIPRAMRFADRASMLFSRELREPFLDHRLLELGLRQPVDRKIRGVGKWLVRVAARRLLPEGVGEAPKRPVQTPQREWLKGPLAGWTEDLIEAALDAGGTRWLDGTAVRAAWREYEAGGHDNSFPVWQWISLALTTWRIPAGPDPGISSTTTIPRSPEKAWTT
jgi:asparagine synthase (glutamine-hydrolysing)